MISIIIPARNEQFLQATITDLFSKAAGEIEVIAVLDGYWPNPQLIDRKNLVILHKGRSQGMRSAINSAAAIAHGEYLMKCDAHCMFGEGYDAALTENLDADWIAIPTRKRLDAENWCIQETGKPDINYMYLSYPNDPKDFGGPGIHARNWDEKNRDHRLDEIKIDDCMSFQGSCWIMHRDHFYHLDLMDENTYGTFWQEAQEIGFKCWLSGGRVIRNKHTWYAHLHKGKKYGRGYFLDTRMLQRAVDSINRWPKERVWSKQTLPFSSMIDRFWPVPTWPDNWKELL